MDAALNWFYTWVKRLQRCILEIYASTIVSWKWYDRTRILPLGRQEVLCLDYRYFLLKAISILIITELYEIHNTYYWRPTCDKIISFCRFEIHSLITLIRFDVKLKIQYMVTIVLSYCVGVVYRTVENDRRTCRYGRFQ